MPKSDHDDSQECEREGDNLSSPAKDGTLVFRFANLETFKKCFPTKPEGLCGLALPDNLGETPQVWVEASTFLVMAAVRQRQSSSITSWS